MRHDLRPLASFLARGRFPSLVRRQTPVPLLFIPFSLPSSSLPSLPRRWRKSSLAVLDDANTAVVFILLTTVVYFDFVKCVL